MDTIEAVRGIEGRDYDQRTRTWTVPATPYHFQRVIDVLKPIGFDIDHAIVQGADPKAPPKKMDYPAGLYPFQRDGVDFLYGTDGRAILADDMGLGKTITTLGYIRLFVRGQVLIVCPASVVWKWAAEWEKWMSGRSVQVLQTGKDVINLEASAIILSYNLMVSKKDELDRIPFQLAVFDEAHALKSYKTQRTKAAKSLVAGIGRVLFLSGTPFMNHPTELFSLLNMLDPVGFSNFFKFAKRYCGADYMSGTWYIPKDIITNRDELADRLERYMIRRTKKEVALDLPDLTRTYVPVDITTRGDYRDAVRDLKKWLAERGKTRIDPAHVLTKLNILRQIVGAGKVPAAIELAEDILQSDEQVVLFCHHKETVTSIYDALKSYGVGIISGDVSQKDRQALVDRFKEGAFPVMIITTAGAEGIDLYTASHIIFVEREWTPAKEEQAEGRLHRMGQKNPVTAWYIVAKNTVDEKLNSIIQTKRALVGQVISMDYILEQLMEDFE